MNDIQKVIGNLQCIRKKCGFPEYGKNAVDAAISAMQELQQYRQIGTLEECREARELRQAKKAPANSSFYACPRCGEIVSIRRKYDYCHKCGQAIDWNK